MLHINVMKTAHHTCIHCVHCMHWRCGYTCVIGILLSAKFSNVSNVWYIL